MGGARASLENDAQSSGRLISNLSGAVTHTLPLDTRSTTVPRFSSTENAQISFNEALGTSPVMVISGEGSLWKSGSGTTIMHTVNTYTGRTMIPDGTLQLGTGTLDETVYTGQLPTGTIVEIGSGATLDLNGIDQTIGGLA